MKLQEALAELEALGDEKVRSQNAKNGAGDNQFGVKLGDVRVVAKKIKKNHDLALELWETGNHDARRLAILLMKPKALSSEEVDHMVRSTTWVEIADWFTNYIVKKHPDRDSLRDQWMTADHPMAARAGWALTAEQVVNEPAELDCVGLLDRIEVEMAAAKPEVQWTMNSCLAHIGISQAKQRKRAVTIGETIGAFRDYPTSKGCTSPFAPIWIDEMVARQT